MSSLLKNLISLAVIIGIVLAAFWYITRPVEDAGTQSRIGVSANFTDTTDNNPANEFAALLNQLSSVNFQGGNPIFNDPVFRFGLVSFRRTLPMIDQSRANPFAPIEGNPSSYIHYLPPPTTIIASTTATSTAAFPKAQKTATSSAQ